MRLSLSAAIAIAAASLCLPAAVSAQRGEMAAKPEATAAVELPLIYTEGRLLLPLDLEGIGRTFFILDTAASGHVVSSDLRRQLSLGPGMIREQTVQGSTGSTTMEFVKLPKMNLGGAAHDDQWAVVADISDLGEYDGRQVTGILGTDILAQYDVEIDVPAGVLRLHPHASNAIARGSGPVIPFRSHGDTNFVQFSGQVAGRPVNVLLDTGARYGILNWKAAGLAGLTPESDGLIEVERPSAGIAGQRIPQYRYAFDSICFQNHCLPEREARISDLPVFRVVGWGDQPAMLVGMDWLESCPVVISYSTSRMRICD